MRKGLSKLWLAMGSMLKEGPELGSHLEKGWLRKDVYLTFSMHASHAVSTVDMTEVNWHANENLVLDKNLLQEEALEDWETDVAKTEEYWRRIDLKAMHVTEVAKKSVEGYMNYHGFFESLFNVADQTVGMLQGSASAISYYQFFCRLFKAK